MNENIQKEWLRNCYKEATNSPDTSTQIGAMLISSANYPILRTLSHNGPTKGWILQPEDLERPRKYLIFEHAERRALFAAARTGFITDNCTLVSTWAACADCARAMVECGITKLIRHYPPPDEATQRWLESVSLGDEILKTGGVEIINVYGPILDAPAILRNGALFHPDKYA